MRTLGMLLGLWAACGIAQADTYSAIWDVATVHGQNEFSIGSGGSSLYYNPQGWTHYAWSENNGSPPGTIAQGMYGNRTGMKTFATTDVACGQKLSDIKLVFEYHSALGGYPSINFFVTDGKGHYGIFSPASGGIASVAVIDPINGWSRMTIDLTRTDISTTDKMAIYEHNGLSSTYTYPYTKFLWNDIKDLTIAGWYDYQRSPEQGWDAWGTCFDEDHGIALIWGDTVNSKNSYGSSAREIQNVSLSFGGDTYAGTFQTAQVPEPAVVVNLLGLLVVGGAIAARRYRAKRIPVRA